MRRYATEFIGTFFLVFTVCAASLGGAILAPLAIGAVLAAMVFAGGHISGGHYNPAVSLAAFVRGRLSVVDLAFYTATQLAAGIIAAFTARYVVNVNPDRFTIANADLLPAFLAELLLTFALAYVVLNVATSKDHPNNSFYGLAVGLTVLAGAVAVGGISGGAFNPAVGLAVVVASMATFNTLWIYLVATLAGGAAAGLVFRLLNPDDN
ncbi:MAG TPA: aquaporin [Candidatus Limnocylindrales bacterium]